MMKYLFCGVFTRKQSAFCTSNVIICKSFDGIFIKLNPKIMNNAEHKIVSFLLNPVFIDNVKNRISA